MKKWLSVLLSFAMCFLLTTNVLAASDGMKQSSDIFYYEISEEKHTTEMLSRLNDNLFYIYSDTKISYCAQIIPSGNIQFSYYIPDKDLLTESEIYDLFDIDSDYSIKQENDQYYLTLNRTILDHIKDFSNVHIVDGVTVIAENEEMGIMATSAYYDLADAIVAEFGANYTGLFKGLSNKTYNGTTYTVRCTESQSTSYTTPDSRWFAEDTAMSAIVAWAIGGAWNWLAVLLGLIETVVSTVVVNGVEKTVDNFTAQRTNVSLMHTRIVTVDGYSGTQYWAGWTRKTYFFKGDNGWVCDTGENWNVKHSDFDDVSSLMSTGWSNFLNYTLTGEY